MSKTIEEEALAGRSLWIGLAMARDLPGDAHWWRESPSVPVSFRVSSTDRRDS